MSYDPSKPNKIRPRNFEFDEVFYFDKVAAIMIGRYKGSPELSIGMRWMEAEGEMGYPVSHGNPMWMVVPDQLALYMLDGIDNNATGLEKDHILDPDQLKDAISYLRARLSV